MRTIDLQRQYILCNTSGQKTGLPKTLSTNLRMASDANVSNQQQTFPQRQYNFDLAELYLWTDLDHNPKSPKSLARRNKPLDQLES